MKLFTKLFLLWWSVLILNATELQHANSYMDALKKGQEQNKKVILFAHSPFCPWCRKMEADTLSNPKVIDILNKNFIFIAVDLSLSMDIEDIPAKFLPQGTPTTYIINPHNEEMLFSLRGYKSVDSFLDRLSRLDD